MDMGILIGIIKMIFRVIIGIPLFCICVAIAVIAVLLFMLMCGVILVQIFGGGNEM